MVKVATFFAMFVEAFAFLQTMDKIYQERMEKEAEIKTMRAELIRENKERESLA
ncbi:hypothetical protein R3W88_017367 [Solanum pinnatisectum]|uniref:Uncharacterized protein n=1 Tax=Solanum pinnatisectum TaxID=50273 RepID=A0AAV9L2I0_9SOLN|nr:hypothetical protein R3W88_017367 [Solanum pinnatisectum]